MNTIRRILERTLIGRSLARAITFVLVFQMLVWNQTQVLAATPAAGQLANAVVQGGSVVNVGAIVRLDASGSFDADNNPLTYRWALTARPVGSHAILSNSAIADPTFVADRVGTYIAQLIVDDGKELSTPDTVSILAVPPPTTVPNVVGLAQAAATVSITSARLIVGTVTTAAHATVPAGNVISQAPAGGTTTPEGSPVSLIVSSGATNATVPNLIGLAQVNAESAIIAAGLTVGTVSLVVNNTIPAGEVFSQSPGAGAQVPGPSPVDFTVSAGPGNTAVPNLVGLTQTQADSVLFPAQMLLGNVTLNSHPSVPAGQIFSQNPAAGATATPGDSVDAVLSTGPFALGGTAPVVTIHSPAADSTVTYLADVVATVTDANLALYQVQFAPASAVDADDPGRDDPDYVLISQGTTPVTNAVVGTFDPTLLENDSYVIRVKAIDVGGLITARTTTVGVAGDAKLGQFSLEFTDLTVPLVGIPIEIVRRYDSFKANQSGDFGYGWSLGLRDAKIRELLKPSLAGRTLAPASRLYLTAPDGRRIGFTAQHRVLSIFLGVVVEVSLKADPGVYEKLEILDGNQCYLRDGVYLGGILGSEIYVPQKYRLTLKDGTKYDYDKTAGLEKITDLNANTVTFTGNAITHSSGQVIPLVRDGQNRITRITDPVGNAVSYAYNAQGDLISFTDRTALQTRFTYRAAPKHYLDSVIDPLGRMAVRTEYDTDGHVVAVIDALGNRQEQSFDPNQFTGTRTDARGNVIELIYNDRGNVTQEKDPEGGIRKFEYSDAANPDKETAIVDPLDRRTTFAYDARGNLTSQTDANDNTTTVTYTALDKPETVTNALGQTVTLRYDASGQLDQFTDNDGNQRQMTRDSQGRVASFLDAEGNLTQFDYTSGCPCGRPGKVINPDLSFRLYEYNALGQVTKETDETGVFTLSRYDDEGKLLFTEDMAGHRSTFTYRGALPEAVSNPLGHVSRTEYDVNNRQIKITNAEGGIVRFEYDADGNRTKVIDPVGNETTFVYDKNGRLKEEINTLGHKRIHSYDLAGNRTEVIDRNGRRRTFTFDTLNRMTEEKWWDGANTIRTLEYAFNALGLPTLAADPTARYDYTYDTLNRLQTVKSTVPGLPDFTLTYAYDKNGQTTSVTDNYAVSVGSEFDGRNRLAKRTWQGSGVDPTRVDFTYDNAGRRTRLDRFTNLAGTQNSGHTSIAYNPLGILRSITHKGPADNTLSSHVYTYDDANRITDWIIDGQNSTYTYDKTAQLLTADYASQPDEAYTYDKNGNRTSTGYLTGPDNQLLADGIHTYTYDNEGNMNTRTHTGTNVVTTYEYDYRNRLVRVTDRSGATVIKTVEFTFDALGRRLSESVNNSTLRFGYNGADSWADFDASGSITARFLIGDGLDEMLARKRAGEGPAWYLSDHLGSVRGIAAATGDSASKLDLTAFGKTLALPVGTDRFLFTGRESTGSENLYHFRARAYDSEIGRFISADPLEFTAGDWNLYRYVNNSTPHATDPTGRLALIEYTAISVSAGQERTAALIGTFHGFGASNLFFIGEVLGLAPGENLSVALERASKKTDDLTCVLKKIAAVGEAGEKKGFVDKGIAGIPKGFVSGAGYSFKFDHPKFIAAKIAGDFDCISLGDFGVTGVGVKPNFQGVTVKIGGFSQGAAFGLARIAGLIEGQ